MQPGQNATGFIFNESLNSPVKFAFFE